MCDHAVTGVSPPRREDARFVTGRGAYLDELHFDGVIRAAVLRSPHARARIVRIETGFFAILTGSGAAAGGLRPRRAAGLISLIASAGRIWHPMQSAPP
jgi:hypothetical protein